MKTSSTGAWIAATAGVLFAAPSAPVNTAPRIPLCAGLTVVTAINQPAGDYESIKTILATSPKSVLLKYSSERMVQDWLLDTAPKLEKTLIQRSILTEDLRSGKLYLQQFYDKLPEMVPGATAIGTSADVLMALKTKGEAEMGIFIPFSTIPSIDRNQHPNVYDNQMIAKVKRVNTAPVMLPVLVNDVRVELPTVQAAGDFFGDKSEFFFLDDPANPLVLKFRVGIGGIPTEDPDVAKALGHAPRPVRDKDTLQVIEITSRCSGPEVVLPGQPAAATVSANTTAVAATARSLEQSLAQTKQADVYDIYFSFDSAQIREESEPRLKEIADVLQRHPNWKLNIYGHTDSIASDAYNLELSRKRAAAVKDALVKRYKIEAHRLATSGFGESRPKDTNSTLEGRARNRRVELVRE